MWHVSPGVIFRGRLRKPDVPRVSRQSPALQCSRDGIAVTNLAARRIHQIRSLLHLSDEPVIKQMFGFRMQWGVDRDNITDTDQLFGGRMESYLQLLLDSGR